MNGLARLSVIIVNWNTRDYLAACISSVYGTLPGFGTEVIVIDNASMDGSAQMVRERFPDVSLMANNTNRGFAGAVNDGLKVAHGKYILILNPDVVLRERVVEGLIAYLDGHPDVGGIMPMLRNEDGSVQKGYVRRAPSLMQVILFATVLQPWASRRDRLVGRYLEAPPIAGDAGEVEQIPGAFLLTTRAVFDKVGPFDDAYRLFFEDVDWCFRVREAGLKLIVLRCLEVTHAGGRSIVVDDGSRIQARYFVSMVTYFSHRQQKAKAAAAVMILSLNALLVIGKNSIFRGGENVGRRKLAALSRKTHRTVLRLFYRAFVLRRDEDPLP